MSLTVRQLLQRDSLETNPIKRYRLSQGLTQTQLGDRVNIRKGQILRYEQGLYHTLTPKLREWVRTEFNQDPAEAYNNWQREQRAKLSGRWALNRLPVNFKDFLELYFPQASNQSVCRALCVHPATLRSYLVGETKTMPVQIRVALKEAGVPEEIVERITER